MAATCIALLSVAQHTQDALMGTQSSEVLVLLV